MKFLHAEQQIGNMVAEVEKFIQEKSYSKEELVLVCLPEHRSNCESMVEIDVETVDPQDVKDTDDHLFYHEHHNGRSPRQKVRVRTYMDTDITFLEVKTENNHGRTKKKRVEVPCQKISAENGNEEFLQGLVHKGLDDMHPTVRNQFRRITLVNYGKTERLTIDFDVHFLNEETGLQAETGNLVIIELKRDGNVYSPVLDILRELRIKPSGFSKYCIGSVMTNSKLKRNTFKPRLVDLRRLSGAALQMA